jgi:MFS family permease
VDVAYALEETEDAVPSVSSRFPSGTSRFPRFLRPLGQRSFALLWTAQTVSLIGDTFYFIALAWLALTLTGSPLALGGVLVAAAIPRGVLMLAGGAVTDRFSPRVLMIGSDGVRALLVGALAALVLAGMGQLWQLYAIAIAFGAVDAAFYPASGAIVPLLVEAERLPAATALIEVSNRGSVMVGPVLAGLMIALVGKTTGTGIGFAVDAASFVVSALLVLLIRGGARVSQETESEEETQSGLVQSIREGLSYAWHDPVIRYLLVVVAGIDVTLNGAFGVGFPVLAKEHLSGGAAALGTLDSGFGLGAVVGIIIAGSIKAPRRRGLLVVGITAGFGIGTALIAFMPNLATATLCVAAMAIGSGLANIIMVPWLQNRTDPSMMGRVMSLFMLASLGLTPLSYAAAGWLASISYTLVFLIGGGIILATALFSVLNPTIRTID